MRRRWLALFLFTVLAFATVAIRQERQANEIENNAYQFCLGRVANVDRTNRLYLGLIAIERANPYRVVSPSTIERRVRLFQSAMLTPPSCGKDPS